MEKFLVTDVVEVFHFINAFLKSIDYLGLIRQKEFWIYFSMFWVWTSYPLWVIAKKFDEEERWLAWIPLINTVMIIRLADKSNWLIVPLIVPYFTIFVWIYLWINIVRLMHRPAFLGILCGIPGINFVILWYLALSKRAQFYGYDIDRRRKWVKVDKDLRGS